MTILEATLDVGLLFMDLGLPGIEGKQLAREIMRRWPHPPILYTSGGPKNAPSCDEAAGHGSDCIAKPYEVARLARTIRAVLDARLILRAPEPA